jgi:hypothetical protein
MSHPHLGLNYYLLSHHSYLLSPQTYLLLLLLT